MKLNDILNLTTNAENVIIEDVNGNELYNGDIDSSVDLKPIREELADVEVAYIEAQDYNIVIVLKKPVVIHIKKSYEIIKENEGTE